LSIASAATGRPEGGPSRGLPTPLGVGAQDVRLRRRAGRVARGGDAGEVFRERDLAVEHRGHPSHTREHVERPQRLRRHVEHRLPGPQSPCFGGGGGSPAPRSEHPREGKVLLHQEAPVHAHAREGDVVRREHHHRVGERPDDGGPLRERSRLGARGHDLRAVRVGVAHHRRHIERRRESVGRLRGGG
jgi:hypothetical protein